MQRSPPDPSGAHAFREDPIMIRHFPAVAAVLLVLAPWSQACAQVKLDIAKITCNQFTLFKITDPQKIAIWLSGYYNAKKNNTVIDTQQFAANTEKLKGYCIMKPDITVIEAVEAVFKVSQ